MRGVDYVPGPMDMRGCIMRRVEGYYTIEGYYIIASATVYLVRWTRGYVLGEGLLCKDVLSEGIYIGADLPGPMDKRESKSRSWSLWQPSMCKPL